MKIRNKIVKIIFAILLALMSTAVLFLLITWTKSVEAKKRENELRKTMKEVIGVYGEKGLLEMAGVPVNDIFYGKDGITLFKGDNASWQYSSDELQNINVFEKCNKAVVHIGTRFVSSVSSFLDVIPSNGVGSGFFVSTDGYIVTNSHVVKDATNIIITTYDGKKYDAQIVGMDEENDIAVLKINVPADIILTALEFGNSSSLTVGQKVLAIGNPFGFDRTMASGIISGLSRPIRNDDGKVLLGMIQTDTPINPGNSGGPLLNSKGLVIGISTSIYSSSGLNEGMNFAVESNTAAASVQDLIKFGKVNRGWIDIVPVQLTQQIVDYAALKVNSGILVSQVSPSGKAEKAGIKGGKEQVRYGSSLIYLGGDVITSINGFAVTEYGDLFTALSNTRPGDKVSVTINRNGIEKTVKVELVERSAENVNWINR